MKKTVLIRSVCLLLTLLLTAAVFTGCGLIRRAGSLVGSVLRGGVKEPAELVDPEDLLPEDILPEQILPDELPVFPDEELVITEPVETEPEYIRPDRPSAAGPMTGEITASVLNIREYPGTDYEIVRGLERGTRVTVYEQQTVDGELWGRVSDGWVSMKYVALDGIIEGSWYRLLEEEYVGRTVLYRVWSFHSDGSFLFTDYRLKESEDFAVARQERQGGGSFSYEDYALWLEFTHGDSLDMFFGSVGNPGAAAVEAEIIGAGMMWAADHHQSQLKGIKLTRGTLENIQKQLHNQTLSPE